MPNEDFLIICIMLASGNDADADNECAAGSSELKTVRFTEVRGCD